MSFPRLQIVHSREPRPYHGPELRPHFLLSQLRIEGSALVAFAGPCLVQTGHLVDWEDRLASDRIEAKAMVHFLGEFFGLTLREGVILQRLLMSIMADALRDAGIAVRRDGDDLFIRHGSDPADRKLSVSIVTASPVSILLHAGINLDPSGAPVPAIGLHELGIAGEARDAWINEVLKRFQREWDGMDWACVKVRPVM